MALDFPITSDNFANFYPIYINKLFGILKILLSTIFYVIFFLKNEFEEEENKEEKSQLIYFLDHTKRLIVDSPILTHLKNAMFCVWLIVFRAFFHEFRRQLGGESFKYPQE